MTDSPSNSSPRLVRACRNERVDRPPVWLMRQAGRYMPEYRAVREKVSFLDLCKNTELATKVSLQPYKAFKTDGVIMFSDILIPPEAMGMEVVFGDGGPSFPNPIRNADDIERLIIPDPNEKTGFVMDLLKSLRHELRDDHETGLIGFAGSPWTLAVYMVEGGGSRHFARIKGLMYEAPEQLDKLLQKLTVTVTHYLNAQIEAGAQVVQLFDTWAGILSADEYRRFILPCHQQILDNLNRDKAPAILYVNNSRGLLPLMVEAKPDVISVDSLTSLTETRKIIGNDIALQGNLDPILLLGNSDVLDRRVQELLREGGNQGYIFNLGHGILPPTPPENVRLVVNRVKESAALYWEKGEEESKEDKSPFAEADQHEKPYHPTPEQEAKHKQALEAAAKEDAKHQHNQNAEPGKAPAEQPEQSAQQEPQAQAQKQASVQPDQKAREQAPKAHAEMPKAQQESTPEQNQSSQEQAVADQQQTPKAPKAETQSPDALQVQATQAQANDKKTQQSAPEQNQFSQEQPVASQQQAQKAPKAETQSPEAPQAQATQGPQEEAPPAQVDGPEIQQQSAAEQNKSNIHERQQKPQGQPQANTQTAEAPQAQAEQKPQEPKQPSAPAAQQNNTQQNQPVAEAKPPEQSPVDRQVEADLKAQAVQNAPDSYQATQNHEFQPQAKNAGEDLLSVGETESRRAQGAAEFDEENAVDSNAQETQTQSNSQNQPQHTQRQAAGSEQPVEEYPTSNGMPASKASSSEAASPPVERVQGITPIEKVGPRA